MKKGRAKPSEKDVQQLQLHLSIARVWLDPRRNQSHRESKEKINRQNLGPSGGNIQKSAVDKDKLKFCITCPQINKFIVSSFAKLAIHR